MDSDLVQSMNSKTNADPTTGNAYARFWAKIDKDGPIHPVLGTRCWLWMGSKKESGYGLFKWLGKAVAAHRFAYLLIKLLIPAGMELDHLCRNRACVNPDHMEPVTHKVNTLRGNTIVAVFAARSACKAGHPYTAASTFVNARGRNCRICRRRRVQEFKSRRAA